LLGVPGFLAAVARELVIRRLDPSVGGSGPHDFAVRACALRRCAHRVHRIPLPTSVTIAIRPSGGGRMGGYNHDFRKNGRRIFFAKGLDVILISRSDLPVGQRVSMSSPGLTGRSSIPETAVLEPNGRGVLGPPVKPGDDS